MQVVFLYHCSKGGKDFLGTLNINRYQVETGAIFLLVPKIICSSDTKSRLLS